MKKTVQRLLSFVLCAALVLGLMPMPELQGSIASAAVGAEYTYKYSSLPTGDTWAGDEASAANGKWQIAAKAEKITASIHGKGCIQLATATNADGYFRGVDYIVTKVYIPEAGTYSAQLKRFMYYQSGLMIYVAPESVAISDITVAGTMLGSVNGGNTGDYKEDSLANSFTVTQAGYYNIAFYGNNGTGWGQYVMLDSIKLSKTDEYTEPSVPDEPEEPEVLDTAAEITYNYTSVPTGTDWAGGYTDTANGRWQITGQSSGVTAALENGYLKLSKASGAYITKDDYLKTQIYIPAAGIYEVESSAYMVYAGYECAYYVYAAPADVENAKQQEYLMGSVSAGSSDVKLEGIIEAEKPGYYTVLYVPRAKWSSGEAGYYLRLKNLKISPLEASDDMETLSYVLSGGASAIGNTWIGDDLTPENAKWQRGSENLIKSTMSFFEPGIRIGYAPERFPSGEYFDIKISVPTVGEYDIAVESYDAQWFGNFDVYIAPESEDASLSKYKRGRVYHSSNTAHNFTTEFDDGIVFDEAGLYTVRFAAVEGSGFYIQPRSITFTPVVVPRARDYILSAAPSGNVWAGSNKTPAESKWQIGEISQVYYKSVTSKGEDGLLYGGGDYAFQSGGAGGLEWFQIKISVPEPGVYNMSVVNIGGEGFAPADVYVAPDGNQPLSKAEWKLGTIPAGEGEYTTDLGAVVFDEAGFYTLGILPHARSGNSFQIKSVHIEPYPFEAKTRTWVFDSLPSDGECAGNVFDDGDYKWKLGETSGKTVSIEDGAIKMDDVAVGDYFETDIYVPAGAEYELVVTGIGESGSADYDVYICPKGKMSLDKNDFLTGEVLVDEGEYVRATGKITLKRVGFYTVRFAAKADGESIKIKNIRLNYQSVDENPTITYNFTEIPAEGSWKGNLSTKSDMPWQIGGTSQERNVGLKINSGGLTFGDGGFRFEDNVAAEWFQVNINVPEAGTYKMSLENLGGSFYGGADVYVSTLGDENIQTEENLIGVVKRYGEEGAKHTTNVGEVTFAEAGIYTVRFKMTRHEGFYHTVFKMQLVPTSYVPPEKVDFKKLELVPSFKENYVGEAGAYLRPLVYDSADAVIDISSAKITYASLNTDVATVDKYGLVTPVSTGQATMKVRVAIGNYVKEASCTITVAERAQTEKTPIVIDFADCLRKGHEANIEHASCENCGWGFNAEKSTAAENIEYLGLFDGGIKSVIAENAGNGTLAVDVPIEQGGCYKVEITLARTGEADMGSWMSAYAARENGAGGNVLLISKGNRKEWLGGLTIDAGNTFLPTGTAMFTFAHNFTRNMAVQRIRLIPVDIAVGGIELSSDTISVMNVNSSGRVYIYAKNGAKTVRADMIDMTVSSSDEAVVKAQVGYSEDGTNRAIKFSSFAQGSAVVTVKAVLFGGETGELEIPITVMEPSVASAKIAADALMLHLESDGMQVRVDGTDPDGGHVGFTNDQIIWKSLNPEVATIDENGWLKPVSVGEVTVQAIVTAYGYDQTLTHKFSVRDGKIRRSLYSEEKLANAMENIEKYKWAENQRTSAVAAADKFLGQEEYLWNLVTSQQLPRSVYVGYFSDTAAYYCRYCNENLRLKYGTYGGWIIDYKNSPWKIQCPACRRKFPTNDFGSFYKLGIVANDEEEKIYSVPSGQWSYEKAHYEHFNKFAQEYKEAGISDYSEYDRKRKNGERLPPIGFLKNEMYTGLESVETLNLGYGLYEGEDPDGWGVDDGYGYISGRYFDTLKAPARDTYIAYYNMWGVMYGSGANTALQSLTTAYLLTGEEKYGRIGAILTDRFADVWPEFKYGDISFISGGSRGKIVDQIWSTTSAEVLAKAYDAFFPMFDDKYVINFLSDKAEQYDLGDKSSGEALRQNCEERILRTNFNELKNSNLLGNFGFHQETAAITAIVFDSAPETEEIIEWMFANGHNTGAAGGYNSGGNIWRQLYDYVDRNGFGNEAAPGYNSIWIDQIVTLAKLFAEYGKVDEKYDLYKNAIVLKMFDAFTHTISVRRTTPSIADSGAFAADGINLSTASMLNAYKNTGNIKFAQLAYFRNGNKSTGLKYDIYTKDPESPEKEIADVIKQYGEFDGFNKSEQLAGYGLGFLRGGDYAFSTQENNEHNTLYDYWMYYGYSGSFGNSHSHDDSLNIGISAYGTYVSADFGYPASWGDAHTSTSLAHNIVQINDKDAEGLGMVGANRPAFPRHFDDAGLVKVIDVDGSNAYAIASKYRRTLVAIEASDDIAYAIDFFRVAGGDKHVYAFHPVSNEIVSTTGLDSVVSRGGTYASENIEFSPENKTSAERTTDIREDAQPDSVVSVDYRIDDIRKYLKKPIDLRLRVTMLGADELDDFTMAKMQPPIRDNNPDWMETIFARRTGKNLTSLFNTVFEPFADEPYIASVEQVPVKRDGEEVSRHEASAIKVTLVNGRVDYIVNTENTTVTYRVDDLFDFQGFLGVYMLKDGELVYSYGNEASVIGDMTGVAEVTGTVDSFTQGNQIKNYIRVNLDQDIELDSLVGKWIDINNDKQRNAAYEILGAKRLDSGLVELDVGDITFVKGLKAIDDGELIFNYIIAPGQTFKIPLTMAEDTSPEVAPISPASVTEGSTIRIPIIVTGQDGREITISGVNLLRGVNVSDGVITWRPDSNQIGENVITVQVSDGIFKKTVAVPVTVYRSAGTSSDSLSGGETSGDNTGADIGTSGGGAGGGASDGDSTTDTGSTDDNTDAGDDVIDSPSDETDGERFIDLGGYNWAKDAIYSLADAGVVNGTSPNIYSPAANIKRADFAIMLARAFNVTEAAMEGFADVDESKYYAQELRLAKGAGIIGGIGDNKFNPEGYITRQDMMLMLYRAMLVKGYKLSRPEHAYITNYADAAQVSEYALDAVSVLIKDGIITGSDGRINPVSNATRAEVAVMLSRVLAEEK